MKTALTVAAAATVLLAGPVARAQPSAADRKAVQSCLERQESKLGDRCIGIVADPCIAAANGETAKATACASRELAVWNAELESALKRVRSGGFKDLSRTVDQAQQSWRASLTTLCPAFNKIDPGMLPGGATYCLLHETAGRALMLRRLGEAVSEH
jgi:hypothetical protein